MPGRDQILAAMPEARTLLPWQLDMLWAIVEGRPYVHQSGRSLGRSHFQRFIQKYRRTIERLSTMTDKARDQIQVEEFHRTFGHPIGTTPQLLEEKRWKARLKWMRSELDEFEEAMEGGDLVKAYDALIDADYFIKGTHVEMGTIAAPGFDIVHGTNMAKLGPDGVPIYDEDGKVLKPEGWVAPEALHEVELKKQAIDAEVVRLASQIAALADDETLPYSIAADLAKIPVDAVAAVMRRVDVLRDEVRYAGGLFPLLQAHRGGIPFTASVDD